MREDEDPRNYFDTRPRIINTVTEAAHKLSAFNFEACVRPQDIERRSLIYVLYGNYVDENINTLGGFLAWKRNSFEAGIEGYNEHAALIPYQDFSHFSRTLTDFIDLALCWRETFCFQAMDAQSLEALQQKKTFQEEPLRVYQIAIPQNYTGKTIATPSEIHGLIRHPRIRFTVH